MKQLRLGVFALVLVAGAFVDDACCVREHSGVTAAHLRRR